MRENMLSGLDVRTLCECNNGIEIMKDAIKMGSFSGYSNITIANNIKRNTAFIVYQQLSNLPGINVTLKPVRYYPYSSLASAVVGYVS